MAKTERLYGEAVLDGDGRVEVNLTIAMALNNLERKAIAQDRELLWDTLDMGIEEFVMDDRTLTQGDADRQNTRRSLTVSALAVRR